MGEMVVLVVPVVNQEIHITVLMEVMVLQVVQAELFTIQAH